MHSIRDLVLGPWRAIPVLGVTQILGWGTLFYPPVLIVPLIAAERGWSITFAMGGFSLALLTGGLISRRVGGGIDRVGGHRLMPAGSLLGALGLGLLTVVADPLAYLAAWMVVGAAMALSMYDPAFASLGRIFGSAARTPITALTLIGGFASTVSWPATHLLIGQVGWRGTYLVYAALLILVALPLHALALPRHRAEIEPVTEPPPVRPAAVSVRLSPRGLMFLFVTAAFAAYAFVPSAMSAHLLAIVGRAGIDPATVVIIGALFGPAQVVARLGEFLFARNLHPLTLSRLAVGGLMIGFAVILLAGINVATAAAFAIIFGAANGLLTISRGTLPLALFGARGYGRVIGTIGGAFLAVQAVAPLAVAYVIEHHSDRAALLASGAFGLFAFASFLALKRPR